MKKTRSVSDLIESQNKNYYITERSDVMFNMSKRSHYEKQICIEHLKEKNPQFYEVILKSKDSHVRQIFWFEIDDTQNSDDGHSTIACEIKSGYVDIITELFCDAPEWANV